jgi:hypothetical protein
VASAPTAEATSDGGRPWPTSGAGPTQTGCWAPNRDGTHLAALEHLAGLGRHRDHRDQRDPNHDRPGRTLGRDLGREERDGR